MEVRLKSDGGEPSPWTQQPTAVTPLLGGEAARRLSRSRGWIGGVHGGLGHGGAIPQARDAARAASAHGRHTVGELFTCPLCGDVWIASTLTAGQLLRPRATRTAMGALTALAGVTALAGADLLQLTYSALVEKTSGGE